MLGNLGRQTAACVTALAATALLVAGCGEDTGKPDTAPGDEAAEQTLECVTDGFDFDQAENLVDDDYKDMVANVEGYLFVQDASRPTEPYIVRAGDLLNEIPLEGLPGQENIQDTVDVEPASGGFIVETDAGDGLSGEEPVETFVTNDGGVESGATVPAPESTPDYSTSAGGVLRTDEWVLSVQSKTKDEYTEHGEWNGSTTTTTLHGHHKDGGSHWEKKIVKKDFDTLGAVGVCGQYVYAPAEDGIHVLDQNADGEEVALIDTPEVVDMEPYQPKGMLIWSSDSATNYSAMPN